MTDPQFAAYYEVWERPIREMARELARGDRDFADDLAQEGAIALAAIDLATVDGDVQKFIKLVVSRRMSNARRQEWRQQGIPAWTPKRRGRTEGRPCGRDGPRVATDGAMTGRESSAGDTEGQRRQPRRSRSRTCAQRPYVPRHWDAAPWPEET